MVEHFNPYIQTATPSHCKAIAQSMVRQRKSSQYLNGQCEKKNKNKNGEVDWEKKLKYTL